MAGYPHLQLHNGSKVAAKPLFMYPIGSIYEYWAGGYDSDIGCDWIVIISSLSVRWVLDRCTSAIQNRNGRFVVASTLLALWIRGKGVVALSSASAVVEVIA